MMGKLFDRWTFVLVILGAVILWVSTGMVFTQDEVSALSRLDFDSFGALIEGGVKTDYHPAFVQVFLCLWTALFGLSELAVKLPFILAGVGSLLVAYRLSSKLYDSSIAILVVTFIAFSHYYSFYFSIARPYAFGTFFVLLQISSLYNWKKGIGTVGVQIAIFVIASVFAAWTHYFALVAAGLVGLWGLIWFERKDLNKYALSCLASLVLFSPHLSLTLYHLSKDGIGGESGWLGSPSIDVWWKYFMFLGQHTWIGIGLVFGSFVHSLSNIRIMNSDQKQFFGLGMFLMFGMFSLAYFYSIFVSPIFQYSILIFGSIPFLTAIIGSWVSSSFIVKRILLGLSICAGLYGLFIEHSYPYKMRYQLYDDIAVEVQEANEAGQVPLVISTMDSNFLGVYKERKKLSYDYVQTSDLSLESLRQEIQSAEQGVIAQVTIPSEFLYMAHDEFGGEHILRPAYELWNSAGAESDMIPLIDTVGESGMSYAEGEEFKLMFAQQLADVQDFPYLTVVADLDLEGETADEGVLVLELHSGEDKLLWRGRNVRTSSIDLSDNGVKVYHALRLQDVLKEIEGRTDLLLVAYYWNKSKKTVVTGHIRLRIYSDVKTRYSFFEKTPS